MDETGPLPHAVPSALGPSPLNQALQQIQLTFTEWDTRTKQQAKSRRRWGMVIAVLEPLAVVPLIIQVVAARDGGPAVAFVIVELIILTGLLIAAFADIGPSQDAWMRGRVRTEALRRERFLVLARVGPYLRSPDPRATVDERLQHIIDEVTEPGSLILPEDPDGKSWRNALEEAGPGATAAPDPRCLDEFMHQRLAYQEHWYAEKSHEHERHFRVQEALLRISLVLAVVLSAMHLMGLWPGGSHGHAATAGAAVGPKGGGPAAVSHATASETMVEVISLPPQTSVLSQSMSDWLARVDWLVLLALILPAISAAVFALQTFLECRRLSRTYQRQAHRLQRLMAELATLRAVSPSHEREHRLKRLVLDTEGILAEELLQWWLHAYRY